MAESPRSGYTSARRRIAKPLIYNATRTGLQKGELRKVDLGGGRSGFTLTSEGGA